MRREQEDEFSLIADYFQNWPSFQQLAGDQFESNVENGDDCFAYQCHGQQVVSTDTLVESVHFLSDAPAYYVGYRALASSVSDLAAMGARPSFFTLALTLAFEPVWLEQFSAGLKQAASDFKIDLKGGDTTKSQRQTVITLTVFGVCQYAPLTRNQAELGDLIVVDGYLGEAAAALDYLKLPTPSTSQKQLLNAYYQPWINFSLAQQLAKYAHACIDISDGLLADLGHICRHSQLSAQIDYASIPLSPALLQNNSQQHALKLALTGGDDYKLCFTISDSNFQHLQSDQLSVIGRIVKAQPALIIDKQQQAVHLQFARSGYQHF